MTIDRTPRRDLSQVEFDAIYSRVVRLSVDVLIRTPEGILLSRRDIPPHQGDWHLPGGTVQFGETVPEAVARVAAEELGVEVKIEKLVGFFEYPQMFASGYKGWPIDLAFEVTITSGTPTGSAQAEEMDYFKFDELPENIIPEQAEFLRKHYLPEPAAASA